MTGMGGFRSVSFQACVCQSGREELLLLFVGVRREGSVGRDRTRIKQFISMARGRRHMRDCSESRITDKRLLIAPTSE